MRKNKRILAMSIALLLAVGGIPIQSMSFTSYARTQSEIDRDIDSLVEKETKISKKLDDANERLWDANESEDKAKIKEIEAEIKSLIKQQKDLEAKLEKLYNEEETEEGPGNSKDEEDNSDSEEDNEAEIKPKPPSNTGTVSPDVGDLVVSEPILNSNAGSIRVTELYSINNNYADCYYRPKIAEVPLLANRVMKAGKYAAAYTGFFDLNNQMPAKPKGQTSRSLEILGYDYLYTSESYDTKQEKYTWTLLSDEGITLETAIMDLYKALGLEQFDIKIIHKRGNYTSGNSPAATLLNRSTITYKGGGETDIVPVEKMMAYETYVFTTRTNPMLYMKKLSQDFNISMESSKTNKLTYADFIVLSARMMRYYGEPEMSKNEMNQLIQVYGDEIPSGMEDDLKEAWIYLKARGVLNIENMDLYKLMSKEDMFDILMRIKDKDSRVNFKEIQVVMALGQDMINNGYYPSTKVSVTEILETPIQSQVDYKAAIYYDYLIPITTYSRFTGVSGSYLTTMFVSDNPNATGMQLEGSQYLGFIDSMYHHYKVPIKLDDKVTLNGKYVRIDTPNRNDKPGAIYIELGGGVLAYDHSETVNGEKVSFFKRRPFLDLEYSEMIDENRVDPTKEYDWSKWQGDDEYVEDDDEDVDEPNNPGNIGFDEWLGAALGIVPNFTWAQDTNGKWRCYKIDEDDEVKEALQGGVYFLGDESTYVGNPQDKMFAFDNDGYMVTGWYTEDHLWYYFNENGNMYYNRTEVIDNETYEFDIYGRWIDMEWNTPEDYEDIWSSYNNLDGTWQLQDDRWWFMMNDGSYPTGSIFKINDKFYAFDDEGYMLTGWYKDVDYYYYFVESDGYMLMNATTPDGKVVGPNGRAKGNWKLSFKASPFYRYLVEPLMPMTVYAAPMSYVPADASVLTASSSGRWYIHQIPKSICLNSEDELSSIFSAPETWTKSGDNYVIRTKRNATNVLGRLKIDTKKSGLEFVKEGAGILNIGSKDTLLVPYSDLYNAGVITDIMLDSEKGTLTLQGGFTKKYSSNEDDTYFDAYGRIILDNIQHRVLVGTTVYQMDSETELFRTLPTESTEGYEYIKADGTVEKVTGQMLYIDFRAVFGWSSDAVSFYRIGNKMYVSIGISSELKKDVKNEKSTIKTAGSSKRISINSIRGYKRPLIPLANMYPIANWSLVRRASVKEASQDTYLIVAYANGVFDGKDLPTGKDKVKEILGAVPVFSDYSYRVFDLTKGVTTSLKTLKDVNEDITAGSFYYEPDFGIVYAPPTKAEWANDYSKYINGTIPLPIVADTKYQGCYFTDMSVPYIEGVPYGVRKMSSNSSASVHPQMSSLAYMLYSENNATGANQLNQLIVEKQTKHNNLSYDSLLFFGQNRIIDDGKGGYLLDGLEDSAGKALSVKSQDLDKFKYIKTNEFQSRGKGAIANNNQTLGGSKDEKTSIRVTLPGEPIYEKRDKDAEDSTRNTFVNQAPLDIFKNYEEFKIGSLIKKIDSGTSLLLLIAMQVLPLFFFTLAMIVFLFALMAEWKAIRWICTKFIDPIEICSFGRRNIENAHGMKFFITVMCVSIVFALWANGNFLRILAWVFQAFGEYMNIIRNM